MHGAHQPEYYNTIIHSSVYAAWYSQPPRYNDGAQQQTLLIAQIPGTILVNSGHPDHRNGSGYRQNSQKQGRASHG